MFDPKRMHFIAADFHPATGEPRPDDSSEMLMEEASVLASYDGIYVFNPRHLPVFTGAEQIRHLGLAQPGQRKRALRVLAASGSGKTTTITRYAAKIAARLSPEEASWKRPVVILSIHPKITVKGWWLAVLSALGEELQRPRDSEETLRRRAYEAISRAGVELLVIDEAQHLAITQRAIGEVSDRLKRFLDDGIVPLVFLGTSDAKDILQSNQQLVNRMLPPADIRPLLPTDAADRAEFAGFLKRLDMEVVKRGLMSEPAGLDAVLVAACLMEVSEGILGRVVNLLRLALGRAVRRRAGRIELCDLQAAVESWAVAQGTIQANPFRPREG